MINEDDTDWVIDEIVNEKDFEKSDTRTETGDLIEELKNPQGFQDGDEIFPDDINERGMIDPRTQTLFKRSRHNNLSILTIIWDYYELSKRTLRADGNIFQIFKQHEYRDVQNLYQDNTGMGMTLDENIFLTSIFCDEEYQPPTSDKSRDKYSRRYPLGLDSMIVSDSNPF